MPSPVITPYMSLTEPTVGGTLSPGWALLLNADFQTIDQHNHTTGLGVPIPPAGLDINSDLSFQGNNLLAVNSLVYNGAVSGTPAVLSTYTNGTDLFYKDVNGTPIQLTNNGSPSSAVGNIQGLPSTPIGGAAIAWVNAAAGFRFLNDTGTGGANLDFGTAILRYPGSYPTPSGTNWVALKVPAAISAGYSLTFPLALPASQKFMTMDAAGNIAAPWSVDNSTLEIASSTTLQVKDAGITLAKMAANSVGTSQIVDGAVTNVKLAVPTVTYVPFTAITNGGTSPAFIVSSPSITFAAGRPVRVTIQGEQSISTQGVLFCTSSTGNAAAELTLGISGAMTAGLQNWRCDLLHVVQSGGSVVNSTPLGMSYTFVPTAGASVLTLNVFVGSGFTGVATAGISNGTMVIEQL